MDGHHVPNIWSRVDEKSRRLTLWMTGLLTRTSYRCMHVGIAVMLLISFLFVCQFHSCICSDIYIAKLLFVWTGDPELHLYPTQWTHRAGELVVFVSLLYRKSCRAQYSGVISSLKWEPTKLPFTRIMWELDTVAWLVFTQVGRPEFSPFAIVSYFNKIIVILIII